MRTATGRLLNAVQRPDADREVALRSAEAPIVLSVWDGQPDRPAVVFLPGTTTHPLFYEEVLDALNRAGITAVGVHAQGHGKSPRVRRPLIFPTLVANARDAVAWTPREFPGRPVAVLDSSQGVVVMACAAAGERLDAVLTNDILDPSLPSTVEITRFPSWLSRVYPPAIAAFRAGGRLLPRGPRPVRRLPRPGARGPRSGERGVLLHRPAGAARPERGMLLGIKERVETRRPVSAGGVVK